MFLEDEAFKEECAPRLWHHELNSAKKVNQYTGRGIGSGCHTSTTHLLSTYERESSQVCEESSCYICVFRGARCYDGVAEYWEGNVRNFASR